MAHQLCYTNLQFARDFRDAPLMIVGEGTNEIQRKVITAQLVSRGTLEVRTATSFFWRVNPHRNSATHRRRHRIMTGVVYGALGQFAAGPSQPPTSYRRSSEPCISWRMRMEPPAVTGGAQTAAPYRWPDPDSIDGPGD
ncbi:hypothetical protein [Mycobacterium sp. E2497]|uniref:hypothetical protein n=1 Tax=Mycobacterium sp. E2497 TaxID=1834135 RepID=UPI0007FCA7C2|nr:hypothetical protein [Mycobacterium sp. E2497]OBI23570.1 hypothetical protein A5713_08985 [Mycobacterium sp. E2497]